MKPCQPYDVDEHGNVRNPRVEGEREIRALLHVVEQIKEATDRLLQALEQAQRSRNSDE